jgi:8-oxoguanine deaminase
MITPYVGGRTTRQIFPGLPLYGGAPASAMDLLVKEIEPLLDDKDQQIPDAWTAVGNGRVTVVQRGP